MFKTFFLSLVFISLFCGCERPQNWPEKTFISDEWSRSPEGERYVFVNNILHQGILDDLTKSQVIDLLGNPSFVDGNVFSYVVKIGGMSFDQVYALDVYFCAQSGRVEKYFVRGD